MMTRSSLRRWISAAAAVALMAGAGAPAWAAGQKPPGETGAASGGAPTGDGMSQSQVDRMTDAVMGPGGTGDVPENTMLPHADIAPVTQYANNVLGPAQALCQQGQQQYCQVAQQVQQMLATATTEHTACHQPSASACRRYIEVATTLEQASNQVTGGGQAGQGQSPMPPMPQGAPSGGKQG